LYLPQICYVRCSSLFSEDSGFYLVSFLFSPKTSCSLFCSTSLLVTKFLRFLSSENVFILPSFLNIIFTEYKILIWQFFSLSILRIIFHLAFMFQRGIQPSIPTGLYYICNILFFSCCFQDTLFIFGFQQFEYHMGFCWQGKSLAVISSCIFSAAFFLSSPSNYTSIILLCNII